MLGYVVSYKPEMKVREAEMYKGYYCGVCKSIGCRYGQLPRMVLSYDAALLAIAIECIFAEQEPFEKEGCIINPFKKKIIVKNHAVDYAADAMLLLAWYKLLDDIEDENKMSAKAIAAAMKGLYGRLSRKQPNLDKIIKENLDQLSTLEKDRCKSLDQAAEPFSRLMAGLLVEGVEYVLRENNLSSEGFSVEKKVLENVGYHLGKWIYIIDAYDDIQENTVDGAYNPLIERFEYCSEKENWEQFKERIKDDVERNLTMYLAHMAQAFQLLDIKKNKGILENIVYIGLLKKTTDVLNGEGDKKDE